MFGNQSANPFEQTGSIGLGSDYRASSRPLWLIALKLLGVAAMVAVGAAIAVPTMLQLEFPLWKAIVFTAGAMCVYTAIAYFIRPEPNTDNMGWGGGIGNDPFKSSDNANRFLWRLHCLLGPGRFTSETFIDVLAFVGLIRVEQDQQLPTPPAAPIIVGYGANSEAGGFNPMEPIAPLDPNRFTLSSAGSVMEQIRDSQRYGAGNSPPAAAG